MAAKANQPRNPAEYLAGLPAERRAVVAKVRGLIRRHLPRGYRECVRWGMLSYEIPLSRYPETYNGQPLAYVALAAQKNHCALYLMGTYADGQQSARLAAAFKKAGKRVDMGKSCLRFRSLDDLPLAAIGETIASTSPERFIALYEAGRRRP
jgi:hypothetical protein